MTTPAAPDARGGRARSKWEAKASAARRRLVEEGMLRILEDGVAGLAALVSPSALARRSGAVSVDTAYRLLGGPRDALLHVARAAVDPGFASEAVGWRRTEEISAAALAEFAAEGATDPAAAIRTLLESGLRDPAFPLSRALRAVAITASPAWTGTVAVSEEHRDLAEEVREVLRSEWEHTREHLRWLVQDALAAAGRRPIAGLSVDRVVVILHAVAEGALDRLALHPDLVTIDEFVDTILLLMLALSEEGALADVRLPDDPEALAVFTRTVTAADRIWSSGEDIGDLHDVARRSEVPFEAVVLLFPTVEALADSVLRARVVGPGIEGGVPTATATLLRGALRRLAQTADLAPALVARALHAGAETSVLRELEAGAQALAESAAIEDGSAARVAAQVVATACRGLDHWSTTEVLIDLLAAPAPGG